MESETVIVSGLKPADDGRGTIVRLWESAGRRSVVRLSFPEHALLDAWQTTPGEFDVARLGLDDGSVLLELNAFESVHLRCIVGR